jgi:methylenetetrahydrofolate dehydrogenase (NADP+) / methenyltetrahydrofolate cyclohydrolase
MLLEWKKLSEKIQQELIEKTKKLLPNKDKYIWIVYLGDDESSRVYVWLKQKYWEKIWIPVHIFGQYKKWDNLPDNTNNDYDVQLYMKQEYDNIWKIIDLISYLNQDKDCVWIIVQLPLPKELKKYKAQILSTIAPNKDIDWMWWILNWLSSIDLIDFVPATPKAVIKILKEYDLYNLRWKIITVIWQSNLVGKPLVLEFIKQWWTVFSSNSSTPTEYTKEICKKSDIIVSCTWVVHLLNDDFIRNDKSQIIIDVWYGHKDGKPVWDIDFESVKDKVEYITPVPGGIWPLTVACLFENIFDIQENLNN